MARPKSGDKLSSKIEAAKALQAEIDKLQAADKARREAETEQRQRIAGRVLLAYGEANPQADFTRTMHELLDTVLKRKAERILFGMEAAPKAGHSATPAPDQDNPTATAAA